jgi:hypothetical protein
MVDRKPEDEIRVRTASLFSPRLGVFSRVEFERAVWQHDAERYA